MLSVRVLGELRVELDGQPLTLPSRRPARALLGWLALHPGMHARSRVAPALWPSVLDESARMSLRSALTALRAAIAPAAGGALLVTRAHLGLANAPEVWVDVREFDRLLADERFEAALELRRGELLADFDDDWVLAARDDHRTRVGEALSRLAGAAAASGDYRAAIALTRRWAALVPFDESAHRELIGLLAEAGDRGAALVAYRSFVDRLRRELGVAPSTATRALAAGLREGLPAARHAQPPIGAHRAKPPPLPSRVLAARGGPLLGREAELARLREMWAHSRLGARQLALVSGEPGIGKTRLVAELAAELDGEDIAVLYGAAREEAMVPYEPLVDCLREPLRERLELPPEAAELDSLIPELVARGHARTREASLVDRSASARLRLFDAFGATLDAVARGRPLLLILEDLHWAEHPTVRLLVHLATRTGGPPRALVVTYRDTDVRAQHPLAAGLADLHRALPVETIGLQGIGAAAVAAMLEHAPAGGRALGSAGELRDRTGGNPFFIEQLLGGAAQRGEEGSRGAPAGVEHVIARRVAVLGPEARSVLDAAAVIGSEFELAPLAQVVDLSIDDLVGVLDAAVNARLIAEVPREPGRYEFVHAIVRETLTGLLTATRRAQFHDLIAQSLAERAETEPDRYLAAAANHALEAAAGHGDPGRAVALAERAATQAGAVLAHEDAVGMLQRALAVFDLRGGSPTRRAELLCSVGEALAHAGAKGARTTLHEASDLSLAVGRSDLVARAALARGGAGVTILGADPGLVAELERALDAVGSIYPAVRARLLARLAIELAYEQAPSWRDSASAEALQIAGRLDDPVALAAALNARHVSLWGPDHVEQRKELADEMLELAERAGDRELALQARNWRIVDLLELGEGQAVRDELDAYAEHAAELRLPVYSWYVPMWRATIALLEGRITDGVQLAQRARDLGRKAGDRNADVFFAEHQLLRHLVEGRLADLDPPAAGIRGPVATRSQTGPAWRAYRFTFAWLHAERGETKQARHDFEAALADGFASLPRDVNWLDALNAGANTAMLLGDLEHARQLRTLLEPYANSMIVNARGALHAGSVAFTLARLAAISGDNTAADQLYHHAVQRDQHAGAPVWMLRDLRSHSSFLKQIGHHHRGNELAQRAEALADAIDLTARQP